MFRVPVHFEGPPSLSVVTVAAAAAVVVVAAVAVVAVAVAAVAVASAVDPACAGAFSKQRRTHRRCQASVLVWGLYTVQLYSKRIYSAIGMSRSFFSSHKCFFKTYKNAFKWSSSNWD